MAVEPERFDCATVSRTSRLQRARSLGSLKRWWSAVKLFSTTSVNSRASAASSSARSRLPCFAQRSAIFHLRLACWAAAISRRPTPASSDCSSARRTSVATSSRVSAQRSSKPRSRSRSFESSPCAAISTRLQAISTRPGVRFQPAEVSSCAVAISASAIRRSR